MELTPCIPKEMNPPINAVLVRSEIGLEKVYNYLKGVSTFGLDLETNVVKAFYDRRIRTIQVGDRNQQYVIDLLPFAGSPSNLIDGTGEYKHWKWAGAIVDTLRPFLESDSYLKVGHNLSFEYTMLKYCLGLRIQGLYDTELAEKVLQTGLVKFDRKGFWGLDDLMAQHFGMLIDKTSQKSFDLETDLTEEQVEYAALDTRLAMALRLHQLPRILKQGLEKAVYIENNAIGPASDIHLNGMRISEERWLKLEGISSAEHKDAINDLDTHFIPLVGKKEKIEGGLEDLEKTWRETKEKEQRAAARKAFIAARQALAANGKDLATFEGQANINYASPTQLLDCLTKNGYTLKSTSDLLLKKLAPWSDVLGQYTGDPLVAALRAYREAGKKVSTYGRTFLAKYVHERTKKIHSNFKQLGADTGRTASANPNVQNIPNGKEWRACFIPDPGEVMVTIDISGCELRILAEESGEKVWIDAFNKGWDVHSVGAEIIFGSEWVEGVQESCAYYANHKKCRCPKHVALRERIKAINFGLAYGLSPKGLAEALGITLNQAEDLFKRYFRAFPAVAAYLEKAGSEAVMTLVSRTRSGRARYFIKPSREMALKSAQNRFIEDGKDPASVTSKDIDRAWKGLLGGIERQGKNTPMQGLNADIVKLAAGSGYDPNGVGYMWHRLEKDFQGRLINLVHDETVVCCPPGKAEACFEFIIDCIKRAGAEFVKSVVMEAEGKISDCWAKG